MSPRPILRQDNDANVNPPLPFTTCSSAAFATSHVHFPPTPTLASTHLTHSVQSYDRAPIQVTPNALALPERGCPGRTYALSESKREITRRATPGPGASSKRDRDRGRAADGSYFPDVPHGGPPPDLVPDLGSSESEDSDGLLMPPPDPTLGLHPPIPLLFSPNPHSPSSREARKALAFLPHPPSPDRERKRRSLTPPSRTVSGGVRDYSERQRKPPVQFKNASSSFAAPSVDDCLGGF